MPPILLRLLTSDAWAIQPGEVERVLSSLAGRSAHAAAALDGGRMTYANRDGVAVVPVVGMLVPSNAAELRAWGENATGYDEITEAISKANSDALVKSIELRISSPGGAVSGVHDAGDAIRTSGKPVHAYVGDLAASAAYWLASQAETITAHPRASIGSIGVYTVAADISGMLAKMGIDLKLISSGGIKGAGADGKITDAHKAEIQKRIDTYAADFVETVAAGRMVSIDAARAWADGRVWFAAEAQSMGLIDATETTAKKQKKDHEMSALALIKQHPQHAAMIADAAEAGDSVDAIKAKIKSAEDAAAMAAIVAERDAAKAAAAKVEADAKAKAEADAAALAAEKARADKAEADLADLRALAAAGKPGAIVKPDPAGSAGVTSITMAEYAKDPGKFAADLAAGRISITP